MPALAGKPSGILSSTCTNRLSLQLDQTQVFQDLQPGVLVWVWEVRRRWGRTATQWPRWPYAETGCVLPGSRAGTSVSPEKVTKERARCPHWLSQEQLVPESMSYPGIKGELVRTRNLGPARPRTPVPHLTLLNSGQVL